MRVLNTQENIVILVLATISSLLSITGSVLILRFIKQGTYRDAVKAQRTMAGRGAGSAYTPTYLRIMAAMSVFDILYSINWILQPVISNSQGYDNLLVGNQASCNFAGFMNQVGFAGFIYYGFLSFYELFTVRWGKSQRWVTQRAEPWMHVIAIAFPLTTAITGLIIDCYDNIDLMLACWVANWPKGCILTWQDGSCSQIPGYIFGGIPFFFFIPALITNNILVYRHVKKIYMRTPSTFFITKNSGEVARSMDERQKKRIKEVGTQTTLYVIAALLTYMPLVINELVLTVIMGLHYEWQARLFPWMCVAAVLTALAGFWNAIIFFRPTYRRHREKGKSRWKVIKMILRNDKLLQEAAAKRKHRYANSRSSLSVSFRFAENPSAASDQAAVQGSNEVSDSSQRQHTSLEPQDENAMPSSDDDDEDIDDDYSEVAAETIPALILARLSAKQKQDEDNENEVDDTSGEEKSEEKILTPGAFGTTVTLPGESQYTVPSTHQA